MTTAGSSPRRIPELHDQVAALEAAGIGALSASGGNLPLRRVAIRAHVSGVACQTTIAQVFANPHREFVEATYIFPLPGRYAVTDCTMRVGGRVIKAELQERSQARATYNQAIAAGHRASIAEEERSETFTLRVGNIPPLEEVAIELTLVGQLSVVDGEGTLRIPLVVAPRYVPGKALDGPSVGLGTASDTDEAPDASRVTPPTLLPGFPNPVALSVEVEINPGHALAHAAWRDSIRSSLHSVLASDSFPVRIRLLPGERLNRDFILRFPVLPPTTDAVAEYAPHAAGGLGTFAVTLFPPAKSTAPQLPRDVVFVLDKSGSMEGWKIVAARRALARMIDTLRETDRFRVLAFSSDIQSPQKNGTDWQVATDRERWQAAEWTAKITACGGTELAAALRAALQPFATFGMPADRDAVVVLITDGQVAGEDSVLRTIEALRLPRMPRILTLGIDRSVNAGLLTRLADLGGGTFELVESEQRLDQVLERFHCQIAAPLLTDVSIEPLDFDLMQTSLTPSAQCHVFADRPLTIYGRCAGDRPSLKLRIVARDASGGTWQQEVTAQRTDFTALLPLWGRGRVRELEDEYARGGANTSQLQKQIVAVSLESHILSRFTAYVAVDSAEVVNKGGEQQQIVQPVETPEGWTGQQPVLSRKMSRPTGLMSTDSILRKARASSPAAVPPQDDSDSTNLSAFGTQPGSSLSDLAAKVFGSFFGSRAAPEPAVGGDTGAASKPAELPQQSDSIPEHIIELVPEAVARENSILPIAEHGDKLVVRMSDPNDLDTIEKLRFILNRPIEVVRGSAEEITDDINKYYSQIEGESADSVLQEFTDTAIDFTDQAVDFTEAESVMVSYVIGDENSAPIVRLVNLVFSEAVQLKASHIVLQPEADRVQIDFLYKGKLHRRDCPPLRLYPALLNRLRILAKISDMTDALQSGEIKLTIGDQDVDAHVYLIPTSSGLAVVIQLTRAKGNIPCLDAGTLLAPWLAAARTASAGSDQGRVIYEQLCADCYV